MLATRASKGLMLMLVAAAGTAACSNDDAQRADADSGMNAEQARMARDQARDQHGRPYANRPDYNRQGQNPGQYGNQYPNQGMNNNMNQPYGMQGQPMQGQPMQGQPVSQPMGQPGYSQNWQPNIARP